MAWPAPIEPDASDARANLSGAMFIAGYCGIVALFTLAVTALTGG